MVQILLIRHGETNSNSSNIIMGHSPEPLNDKGKEQARKCGLEIKRKIKNITDFYSSPILRAQQTAEIVKEQIKFSDSINYDRNLSERNFGEFSGLSYTNVVNKFKTLQEQEGFVGKMDINLRPKGGESYLEFYSRSRLGFESLLRSKNWQDNETILVLSHGGTIRHILGYLLLSDNGDFKDFPISVRNCSMTSLNVRNSQKIDVKVNFMNYYQYLIAT